eukprot:CAMPEP_0197671578 /NCGR_PEP_ID=MMETSP1338-20131121/76958_1 /TAXON_ID=43686 ORGANISM="Pelagodinium beii, Strain RCC1491" /NCGR_SAMPLE_ID=MMETSP1338 /ASSEMBLY_ACC=CAM_ASM_000754 /LENGTH=53 /DNA_ID=CAMNT_0043251501 /DNA_START=230 /DNA_END=391 /DNA_ORIENTATION=+
MAATPMAVQAATKIQPHHFARGIARSSKLLLKGSQPAVQVQLPGGCRIQKPPK